MCGMPWAVRRMVAAAPSAEQGSTRQPRTAAVSAVHPLTAGKGIGAFALGAPVTLPHTAVRVDYSLFKDVNGLSGSEPFDSIFKFAANDLTYVILALVALTFLVPWRRRRVQRRRGPVAATVSSALGLLLVVPISSAVARTRPFVAHPGVA